MSDELHKYPGNLKHHKVEPLPLSRVASTDGEKFIVAYYEAARAKDAELIQRLVDALHHSIPRAPMQKWRDAIEAAEAAGFKPSEQ